MNGWQTYRLEDFIPFTPDIYWRLLERINEAFWPLHVLAVAIGLTALLLALRGLTFWLASLIPILWCVIGSLTLMAIDATGALIPLAAAAIIAVTSVARSIQSAARPHE
ncbi:hypothetical protein [Thioalkalivibrio paradoxus]|uniref:Uncharacterized protein n=1 Tax=Thioalkalivibrio paradoxus ARh 1 TaxID=713585 RepID=W0DRQ4_9GAMM|nr:hypothetical protein [Thioalkalivibrio paradoxus]AHE99947.1 hypothetical protein THITH_04730 [Thioalkalivibrio paradoxus ARh 1]